MWKMVFGSVFTSICLLAQGSRAVLLSEPKHVEGVVVDSQGEPIAGARIGHTNTRDRQYVSDSQGRFELVSDAPVLVVRKGGFRSGVVRTGEASTVRVQLERLPGSGALPRCRPGKGDHGIKGWMSALRFPRVPGVKANRQSADIDYGTRGYYVKTRNGTKWIVHGSGPLWSLGSPRDDEVWRSIDYSEVVYGEWPALLIDARGRMPDGSRWRTLIKFGESAGYSDLDEATAAILDKVLDGACLDAGSNW